MNSQTGKQRAFCYCKLGTCPVDIQELHTWEIIVSQLIRNIGIALEFSPPFNEVLLSVWFLGRRLRRECYFIHRVRNELSLKKFFESHPTAVFFNTSNSEHRLFNLILPQNRYYNIKQFCTMDDDCNIKANMQYLDADWQATETGYKSQSKSRLEKIDRLIDAMKRHYIIARSHYYATGGEILRRPTWAELAKQAGVNEMDISRCLKDKKAVIFQTLWTNAENLKAILNSN
jgi:hypothetical protein